MTWPLYIDVFGLRWLRDYYVSTSEDEQRGMAVYKNAQTQSVIHVHCDGEDHVARIGADSPCASLGEALEVLDLVAHNVVDFKTIKERT